MAIDAGIHRRGVQHRLQMLAASTLLLGLAACNSSHRVGSSDTAATSPAVVSVTPLSTSDASAITQAFDSWESLPATCFGQIKSGTTQFAELSSSGIAWAIADFVPVAGCSYSLNPAGPGLAPRPVPVSQIGPWGHAPVVGVFQKVFGTWAMNDEGGKPFPCPAPGGAAPGPGNGALPVSVVSAWGLTYAANCALVTYPFQPRN